MSTYTEIRIGKGVVACALECVLKTTPAGNEVDIKIVKMPWEDLR